MEVEIDANDTLMRLKITSATCSLFAVGATGYRLYKRRRRLWADDIWALFASVALVIQVVAVFLHVMIPAVLPVNALTNQTQIPPPNNLSYTTRIAVYYLTATTFYSIVWASRLSILFSIIRIDPSAARRRRLFCAAVLFLMTALLLLAQLFWVCESRLAWKHLPNPQCGLPRQVAIFQFVTDVLSDAVLLFAPWPLFRSLVDKSLGHKLTIIFSICVVTTIASLAHASFILKDDDLRIAFSGIIEGCLSLIVANIPVIITTSIDIVGQPPHGETAKFSTIFWLANAETTGTLELQIIGQETTGDMSSESWNSSPKAAIVSVESHSSNTLA